MNRSAPASANSALGTLARAIRAKGICTQLGIDTREPANYSERIPSCQDKREQCERFLSRSWERLVSGIKFWAYVLATPTKNALEEVGAEHENATVLFNNSSDQYRSYTYKQ